MGGIVAGFLGGASAAMADMGKMTLANKLAQERDEANFLRDSELRKTLQSESLQAQESQTSRLIESRENIAGENRRSSEDIAKGRNETTLEAARIRADAAGAGSDTRSSQQKNIDDLMSRGKSLQEAIQLVYSNATIKHTDAEGNQIVVVQTDNGFEEIGKIMINDAGEQEWVPKDGEPTRTRPTKEELEAKAKEMNQSSGKADDYIPFNEYKPSDKEVKEAAKKDLQSRTEGGLVAKKMPGDEVKKINGKDWNKQQFIDAMVKRYGKDKMAEIEETWEGINQ